MILPTKHISMRNSYLGCGKTILERLERPMTVNKLWESVRQQSNIATAQRFYRTLDFLFMLDLIGFSNCKLHRRK